MKVDLNYVGLHVIRNTCTRFNVTCNYGISELISNNSHIRQFIL